MRDRATRTASTPCDPPAASRQHALRPATRNVRPASRQPPAQPATRDPPPNPATREAINPHAKPRPAATSPNRPRGL